MKLYVYTVLSTVGLSAVLLLSYVAFSLFGGVMPSDSAYKRFSLYPYNGTIQRDVVDVKLQPAENVQFTAPSDYFRSGVNVPYRMLQNSDISHLKVI